MTRKSALIVAAVLVFLVAATVRLLVGPGGKASAADAAAGKAKVDAICAECHEAADWEGMSEAELAELIGGVAKGTTKHEKKKLQLTDADVANVAAYWASAAKK